MTAAARRARGLSWLLDQFEELIACAALIVVVLSVSWGVLTRYITEQPAAWASEVATLGFAWVVFFGAAACFKYHLHPTIDLLLARLPERYALPLRWLNHALLFAFFAFMVWFGVRFTADAMDSPSAVLRLPLAWLYGPVTAGFALMAVRYVQVLRGKRWRIEEARETHAG